MPKAMVVGLADSVPVATEVPVPVTLSVVVAGLALLVKVSVPEVAPVAFGLKVTVKGTLWPDGIVTGSESPLMAKRALFELAAVTVTLAPLALSVPVLVPL